MGVIAVLGDNHVMHVASVAREVQIPLLAALLLGACVAKARRTVFSGSIEERPGPTAMFPVHMRRSIAIALFGCEFALGAGLVLTAGRIGAGPPALVIRSATALLFATAVAALYELRGRHPDAGCGCFGDLSDTPVSWQSFTRSIALCAAAIATIGAPPLHLPTSGGHAVLVLAVVAVELLVLAMLSPEIGEVMVRLGYSEPCEVRRLPVSRTLAALRASSHWRRYRRYLLSPEEPIDVWREGCWRYVVFHGMVASRRVEVVFAVYLKARRAPVRAGIFDPTAERRSREAADSIAAAAVFATAGAKPVPAQRPAPAADRPGRQRRPAPLVLSVKAPHGVTRRVPQRNVHHAPYHRHRHSAGL